MDLSGVPVHRSFPRSFPQNRKLAALGLYLVPSVEEMQPYLAPHSYRVRSCRFLLPFLPVKQILCCVLTFRGELSTSEPARMWCQVCHRAAGGWNSLLEGFFVLAASRKYLQGAGQGHPAVLGDAEVPWQGASGSWLPLPLEKLWKLWNLDSGTGSFRACKLCTCVVAEKGSIFKSF